MVNSLTALFISLCAPGAVPAPQLAAAVVAEAAHADVDPLLVARVVIQESRCLELAVNTRTGDYGLMQINYKAHKLPTTCSLNWRCNLKYGVSYLKKLRRPCNFNLGPAVPKGDRIRKCLQYEEKLAILF